MFEIYYGASRGSPEPCSICKVGNNGKSMFCKVWVEIEGEPAECKETCIKIRITEMKAIDNSILKIPVEKLKKRRAEKLRQIHGLSN